MKIAVNGAGIAGPTLAYWLRRSGHEVTLIEVAPRLRSGGYVIDFWGLGYDIAEKMGLLPQIRALGYQIREVRFVNRRGRRNGGFTTDAFSRLSGDRFTSVRRSGLAATLYGSLDAGVETLFGDTITSLEDLGDRVGVRFQHAAAREFDLVIGAGGMHSLIRALAFGHEANFEVPLGFHVAAFEADGYERRDDLVYVSHAEPGRQVSRLSMRSDKTMFLFVFRDQFLKGRAVDAGHRKETLAAVFADVGWECPRILQAMRGVDDIYLDRVSQVRMDTWAKGRVALIGDAAAGVSLLAGEGTGLAMAEAYILAGELHASAGDHVAAFHGYQRRMMPFLQSKQASAARFASTFVPKSAVGIAVRNAVTELLRIPALANYLIGRGLHDDLELPDYGI